MVHQSHIFPFLWVKGEPIERVRNEIEKIKSSGIDEFVVESRPHPHFLQEKWWSDFGDILQIANELEMRIWLLDDAHFPTGYANGAIKEHPELKKNYLFFNAVDLYSEGFELSVNLNLLRKPKRKWSDQKRSEAYYQSIELNKIEALVAYPLLEDNIVSEDYLDLTVYMEQDFLNYTFPKGVWRLFVVYRTTENGGEELYIDMLQEDSVKLLIDSVYEPHFIHFNKYFGNTFRGFFSDEPGFGNASGFSRDEIIGQKDMALPWSQEVADILRDQKALLPLLWKTSLEKSACQAIRYKYMNLITDIYSRNFTQQLGNWCNERGVEYIGHIIEDNNMHARLGTGAGHYFKAMEGQTMAGIDIISTQITIGGDESFRTNSSQNDGTFYQYCLPKLADSSAQLDPNKANQAFCELYGAYGWQLTSRNMKWIMDSLMVRGVTNFVPHAFSMDSFPDLDSPPHFYANGFNPQFPLFSKLMSHMGKSADLYSGAKVKAKVAILYHAELEWLGDYMKVQVPSKVLSQAQIDFLYLPTNWIEKTSIRSDGFQINNHHFEKIIIPRTEFLPKPVFEFIQKLPKDIVIFVDAYPNAIVNENGAHPFDFKDFEKIFLADLPEKLSSYKMIELIGRHAAKIAVRCQVKNGIDYLLVHNESLNDHYTYTITPLYKQYIYSYGMLSGTYQEVTNPQEIAPYQMQVYILTDEKIPTRANIDHSIQKPIEFLKQWKVQLTDINSQIICKKQVRKLPILAREFPEFSGTIRYQNSFKLENTTQCLLNIERAFDGAIIYLNNEEIDKLIAPPYQLILDKNLRVGENVLEIVVPTTADRQLTNKKLLHNQFEPMEPIGIVGHINIFQYD